MAAPRAPPRRRARATAHRAGHTIGAPAERARRELAATGEIARKRSAETSANLTPQESQITRLPRDGLSNPEIGARLSSRREPSSTT
jgi:DNA-binding NarL/FixJ family response regulator